MKLILLLGALFLAPALFTQQQPSTAQVVFQFDRPVPGIAVPHYTIEMHADGTGLYHAEIPASVNATAQTIDRPLAFTPATVHTVLDGLQQLRAANAACNFKGRNIADTGTKTLTLHDPAGDFTCTFNAYENKTVGQLNDLFLAVETTLEMGRALDFKRRFDRLGLDATMQSLEENVTAGRAIELGNIAPTLRSIARDTELIQRARRIAANLLQNAGLGQPTESAR